MHAKETLILKMLKKLLLENDKGEVDMAKTDRLADFLASESKDASSVTMDELLVKAEDMTLADHDKIHHPNGYKEGDECKLREDFKSANAGEELTDPNTELHADAQVSTEARHSTSLNFGKWLNGEMPGQNLTAKQRYDLQSKFQHATQGTTANLLKELNDAINGGGNEDVDKVAESNLVGYFQDTGTDGLQEEVAVDLDGNGSAKDISDANKKVIDAYCCLIGLLRKQDGVSWHAPIYDADLKEQNGIEFDIGRKITEEEYMKFAHYLDDEIEKVDFEYNVNGKKVRQHVKNAVSSGDDPKFGLVSTKNGVRIIDFCGNFANYEEMQRKMEGILEECRVFGDSDTHIRGLKSTGNYLMGGWMDNSGGNGQGYFDTLKEMFQDRQTQSKIRAVYEKYAPKVNETEETAAREIGYEGHLEKAPSWRM